MNLLTSALLTDIYQINMIQAYLDHGETKTAVFEFFVRKFPPRRRISHGAAVSNRCWVFSKTSLLARRNRLVGPYAQI